MNPNPPKKPPATATNEPEDDLEERIRLRAHELYEARGRQDGRELEDWLRAEEEVTKMNVRAIAA